MADETLRDLSRYRISVSDGTNTVQTTWMEVEFVCDANSNTLSMPASLTYTSVSYEAGDTNPMTFVIDEFVSSNTVCGGPTYSVYADTVKTATTEFTLTTLTNSSIQLTLGSTEASSVGSYSFSLLADYSGAETWATVGASQTFVVNTICGSTYTTITVGAYQTGLSAI